MRKDGRRVKGGDPMYLIIPQFMVRRYDSMNMVNVDVPMAPMQKYINEKRKQGVHVSHMAIFLASYLRTVLEYPSLNRFIINRKVYDRNEIAVALAVLKPNGDDTISKLYLEPTDTVYTIQKKIDDYIEQNAQEGENNNVDKIMGFFAGPLSPVVGAGIRVLKGMDKFGLLPKSIIDISPFHASVLVSNLASIRSPQIFHHLYDFGTTSMSITMGTPKEVPKKNTIGISFEKVMPLGFVMDERIANGQYLISSFRCMKRYMTHPEELEKAAE